MRATTATAIREAQLNSSVAHALDHLLHKLRDFMRAYPRDMGEDMPEHTVDWTTGIDDGPRQIIGKALAEHPELWAHGIPDDVCIVHRESLQKFTQLSDTMIDYMDRDGKNRVQAHAYAKRDDYK